MILVETPYAVRDPVHGFVKLNPLEWELINQPCFQRLRRVRQLGWTDYVYPGAMHTRFEHSIGVMEVVTRLFDSILRKDKEALKSLYSYTDAGFDKQRQLVRLAALTHDLGHAPFSHAAEDLFPIKEGDKRFTHEEYSAFIAKSELADLIRNHRLNRNNFGLTVDDIAAFFSPNSVSPDAIVWRELISGQMDADRMDYLLRDAHHAGVSYGRYDIDRVIDSICLCSDGEDHLTVGVEEDGAHAVEGLIIARYMMFTQVYYHKTRSIYDFHYENALSTLLTASGGHFPEPQKIRDYIDWDDWKVLGMLSSGEGGEHGKILRTRSHNRLIHKTPEVPSEKDNEIFVAKLEALKGFEPVVRDASKSWYKFSKDEIRVRTGNGTTDKSVPLANRSSVVNGLATINQKRIYVPLRHQKSAREAVREAAGDTNG